MLAENSASWKIPLELSEFSSYWVYMLLYVPHLMWNSLEKFCHNSGASFIQQQAPQRNHINEQLVLLLKSLSKQSEKEIE